MNKTSKSGTWKIFISDVFKQYMSYIFLITAIKFFRCLVMDLDDSSDCHNSLSLSTASHHAQHVTVTTTLFHRLKVAARTTNNFKED